MGAPFGNNFGTILKDAKARQDAYEDFCRHLSEGFPIKAWSYRKEPFRCSWATMLRYIKENPTEFDSFLKEEAQASSYKRWFTKGIKLSDGEVKGNPSPQTWATIMRNMFDWDKEEKPGAQSASETTKVILADMDNLDVSIPKPEASSELPAGDRED